MSWYKQAQLSEEMTRNYESFIATTQNVNPQTANFAVDKRQKAMAIPPNVRSKINSALHDMGDYFDEIPIDEIFAILKSNGVVPLQEDGTEWAGMIGTQGECGHQHPPITIDLAVKGKLGYIPAKNMLIMTICTSDAKKSKQIEIIKYVS